MELVAGFTVNDCWAPQAVIESATGWEELGRLAAMASEQSGSEWAILDCESLLRGRPHITDWAWLASSANTAGLLSAKLIWNPMRIRQGDEYLSTVFYKFEKLFSISRFMDANAIGSSEYEQMGVVLGDRRITRLLFGPAWHSPSAAPGLIDSVTGERNLWFVAAGGVTKLAIVRDVVTSVMGAGA
jgi:hypothetical protein